MNWKAYYENITYDVHTRRKVAEITESYQNSLSLPQQIVEMYKQNYQLASPLQDEALTKLLAYGRIFIVQLNQETHVIDEYSNKAIFRIVDGMLYYLEFYLHKKRQHQQKIVDFCEKHIFEWKNDKIIHQKIIGDLNKEEIVKQMPQEFALEIAGKKGVPCYYLGQTLIGEINALYQKIMHYYEVEDYVFLQVMQEVIKETDLLRIQLKGLYCLLGVQPIAIEPGLTSYMSSYKNATQQAITHVAEKVLNTL